MVNECLQWANISYLKNTCEVRSLRAHWRNPGLHLEQRSGRKKNQHAAKIRLGSRRTKLHRVVQEKESQA